MLDLAKLSRKEILDLWNYRCKHGHRGTTHINCWREEHGIKEKVGFLDIEASNLKANFGIMYTYCIKPLGSKEILFGCVSKRDMRSGNLDRRVVEKCIKDMQKFDRIVTHYGSRFDIPFIRTRALIHKLPFPVYGEIKQTDTWALAKDLLALHSNRQAVVAESLFGKTQKTRLDNHHWIRAMQGDRKSIDYILDHNIKDVLDLERNYLALYKFARRSGRSI